MSYTYLITGATSDVGRALIERLLQNAPADTLVLAQGCGDLEKLADLCARFPGQVRPFDVDLSDRAKVDTFVQVLAASAPAPTHFIHLPALPVVNAKFKAFDQTRFDRDLEIQVHSAVRLCRAVLPAMAKARFGRVLFIQTSYTIGCPPKNIAAYVMAKSAIGGLVKSLAVEYARFGVTVNLRRPQHDGDELPEGHARSHRAGRGGGKPHGPQRNARGRCTRHGVPALRRGRLHHRRNAAGHGRFGHCLIQHSGRHASARMPPSSTLSTQTLICACRC